MPFVHREVQGEGSAPLDEVIPLPIRAYPTGGMANLR